MPLSLSRTAKFAVLDLGGKASPPPAPRRAARVTASSNALAVATPARDFAKTHRGEAARDRGSRVASRRGDGRFAKRRRL